MKKIIIGFSGLVVLTFIIIFAVNAQNKNQEVEKAQSEVSKDCSHSTSACDPAKCASMECDHAKCEEGKCDPAKCASMECDHAKCEEGICDTATCKTNCKDDDSSEMKCDPVKCAH